MPEWRRSVGRDAVATIVARWPIIVVIVVVGALAGFGASSLQTATYRADVTLYASSGNSERPVSAYEDALASQSRVVSYARLVHSSQVLEPAIQRSGVGITLDELNDRVSATTTPETALLTLSVSGSSAGDARRLVGAVATAMTAAVAQLETPAGETQPNARLTVLDDPTSSLNPVSPSRSLNIGIGIVLGLLLGVGGVLTAERLNNRVRSVEDVERLTGRAPLAVLPPDPGLRTSPSVDFSGPEGPSAAEYRRLRNSVLGRVDDSPTHHVVLVTSPAAGEGKSTVALNLSTALAETGRSVCLITPSARLAAIKRSGGRDLPSSLVVEATEDVLTAGAEDTVLTSLRSEFDDVVVDGEAMLHGSLAETVARSAEVVLLVAQQRRSRVSELRSCSDRLTVVGASVTGIVLNQLRSGALFARGQNKIEKGTRSAPAPRDQDHTPTAAATNTRAASGRHSPA